MLHTTTTGATTTGATITWTATAVLTVWTQELPLWIIVCIWIVWGFLALINQKEINYRTIPTYLISWAMISASWTNIIVHEFFADSKNIVFISIWVAFLLWILGHVLVDFVLENKLRIKNKLRDKLFDKSKNNDNK